jgi:CRISPR system Cascade subunit CasC
MKLLELHLLHSHAVFNGNRDDLGRPKSCIFGGVKRARISSQCHKRAIRLHLRDNSQWHQYFQAVRTKKVVDELAKYLSTARDPRAEHPNEEEFQLAQAAGQVIAGLKFEKDFRRVTTTMFFSGRQYEALAKEIHKLPSEKKDEARKAIADLIAIESKEKPTDPEKKKAKALNSQLGKLLEKLLDGALEQSGDSLVVSDAADIALFGRMVASHSNLNIEAAAMFSHAISTHHAEPEQDFYTAVDDKAKDETGADMMGQLEFVSATYYRYIAVNLDLLFTENLACFADAKGDNDEQKAGKKAIRQDIIRAFTEAVLLAVPSGRQATMNSHTSVAYALGVVREGQPLQLVNAFENPVAKSEKESGLLGPSVSRLQEFRKKMFAAWEITDAKTACFCPAPPSDSLEPKPLPKSQFIDALVSHVP